MGKHVVLDIAIRAFSPKKYLEIGLDDALHFKSVPIARKIGVDPYKAPILDSIISDKVQYFQMDSLKFLKVHKYKVLDVDIAFIDGLHEYHQVLNETVQLLQLMPINSRILLHDCNPTSAEAARSFFNMAKGEYGHTGGWNGDVWKAILLMRRLYPKLDIKVLDVDQGTGFIKKTCEFKKRDIPDHYFREMDSLTYADLDNNRVEYLNLRPVVRKGQFIIL